MKKYISLLVMMSFVVIVATAFVSITPSVFAQATNPTTGGNGATNPTTGGNGATNPTTGGNGATNPTTGGAPVGPQTTTFNFDLPNPVKAESLQCLLFDVINGVIAVLAIVAALYIIYSGFLFVSAQGKPAEIEKAKKSFFNAVIGTAILLGAWAITTLVVNVVNQIITDNGQQVELPTDSSC